ncbi:uncharacterized protein ATC70_001743 [Mucor velutinosus]|uniref:Uncharacterized protein n=1 Tax=Mucor velutinosus TaxID=708070 RepID=A0AAN7DAZ4_9FUNG|nr:hypothetical protein ATC70_001743 [Mucor velutinosus]
MTPTSNSEKEALEYVQVTKDNAFFRLTGIMRQAEVFGADQPTIPKIIWSATSNYRSLFYNGHEISINSISRLLLSLKDQANLIMHDDLLLGANVPCLGDPVDEDNTEYVDKMSSERIGYSFLNDVENEALVDSKTSGYIPRHILSNRELRERFFGLDGSTPNHLTLQGWLNQCEQYVKFLATIIHIEAGQPTRGTEISSSTIINNSKGGVKHKE